MRGSLAPDVVAWTRDPRIDSAVYFDFYAPGLARRHMSVDERVRYMQRLTGARRDLIVVLGVDPTVAVERIEERIALEKQQTGSDMPMRGKWRHMHEDVENLGMLAAGYSTVLAALQEINPTRIVEIDTTHRPREVVSELAYTAITGAMDGTIAPHTRLTM